MIPMRYAGPLHCFGLIFREEGIRGLFRGYVPYIAASMIVFGVLPFLAELSMLKDPIYGEIKSDKTTELYDEVKE